MSEGYGSRYDAKSERVNKPMTPEELTPEKLAEYMNRRGLFTSTQMREVGAHFKGRIAALRAEVKFLNECIDSRDTLAKGLWERIEMLTEQLDIARRNGEQIQRLVNEQWESPK